MPDSLAQKYGPFFAEGQRLRIEGGESGDLRLQAHQVPEGLRPLLPYAEFWGISDDGFRIELINRAPPEIWRDLRQTVAEHESALLDWLSGPEADEHPSAEYLAFSYLLQAFDWPRD